MNDELKKIAGNESVEDCTYSNTKEITAADNVVNDINDTLEESLSSSDAADNTQDTFCPACSARRKERSEKEYKDLMNRLNRVEGQIRGIKKMLEKDAYCTDIITQVMAANAALNSFNRVLLSEHIRTCVTDDIKADKTESVDELIFLLSKLMK